MTDNGLYLLFFKCNNANFHLHAPFFFRFTLAAITIFKRSNEHDSPPNPSAATVGASMSAAPCGLR